jgi:hypothetical protein
VGDSVQISQTTNTSEHDTTCIDFSLVASVAETATVRLQMDFLADNDGDVDYEQIIPTSDWAPLHYLVTTPSGFWKIRFILRKDGPGRAVLAQIRATASNNCKGPPVQLNNRPSGITCDDRTQCKAGQCVDRVCGECTGPADCQNGQVCGLSSSGFALYPACVAPASHSLGERCQADAECATGFCCHRVCSTCCDSKGCATGSACQQDVNPAGSQISNSWAPSLCSPGQRLGASAAPCFRDDDCASRHCIGSAMKQCGTDARLCTADSDCVYDPSHNGCTQTGIAHGQCQ